MPTLSVQAKGNGGFRMTAKKRQITGGVGTHGRTHHAAAIDHTGGVLGDHEFAATAAGYHQLLAWLRAFGRLVKVGVEGTGAYGAGLARHLSVCGITVVEVDRPDRKTRRTKGKSDPIDALAAVATRITVLDTEIAQADRRLRPVVARTAPTLSSKFGVGAEVAGQLLTTAGDNPDRLRSEAALPTSAVPLPSRPVADALTGTDSTVAVTEPRTALCTRSCSAGCITNPAPTPTSRNAPSRDSARKRSSVASSARGRRRPGVKRWDGCTTGDERHSGVPDSRPIMQ